MKDRVVCIDDKPRYGEGHLLIKKGEIYTIIGESYPTKSGWILMEVKSEYSYCGAFHKNRFRPVDSSFGEVVCETIEQQIELEKVLI